MKKKSFIILICISFLLSLLLYSLTFSQKNIYFNASNLPGQLGKVTNTSKSAKDLNKTGFLSYGPYVNLPDGKYTFTVDYTSHKAKDSKIDIVTNMGKVIYMNSPLLANNKTTAIKKTLNINNRYTNNKLEIRIWYGGATPLS